MFSLIKQVDFFGKMKALANKVKILNIESNSNNKNSNNSVKYVDNRSINIYLPPSGKIDKQDLALVDKQLRELPKVEGGYLLSSPELTKGIKFIESYEESSSDNNLIDFIEKNLPRPDVDIWYVSLAMKKMFESGDSVGDIKRSIVSKHGDRGRNISNLCSTNYLETLIIPLHKHIVVEENDEKGFKEIYETIVMESPTAVFVTQHKAEDKIKNEIVSKIQAVSKYGHNKVAVHGLGGDNIKTIKKLMKEIESELELVVGTNLNFHETREKALTATFYLK